MGYFDDVIRITSNRRGIDTTAEVIPFREYRSYGYCPGYHGRENFLAYTYVFTYDSKYYFTYLDSDDYERYKNNVKSAIEDRVGFEPDEVYYWGQEYYEE